MAIRIDAGDLVSAVTSGDELRWYLDLDTGAVGPRLDDDDLDEGEMSGARRLRYVPTIDTREAYHVMERFAETVHDVEISELLDVALEGKGAFRRFKDVVHRWPDVANAWHEFHDEAMLAMAVEWLESAGIEAVIDAPPKRAPAQRKAELDRAPTPQVAASPAPRKGKPRIGLLEMLLLGAPDGDTELVDGKVPRVFIAESPAEANKVFADIARDIHERAGLGWRRSYIEGKTSVVIPPYELRVDAHDVELDVALEPGLWKRFR